jgi:hypothetical protein
MERLFPIMRLHIVSGDDENDFDYIWIELRFQLCASTLLVETNLALAAYQDDGTFPIMRLHIVSGDYGGLESLENKTFDSYLRGLDKKVPFERSLVNIPPVKNHCKPNSGNGFRVCANLHFY